MSTAWESTEEIIDCRKRSSKCTGTLSLFIF